MPTSKLLIVTVISFISSKLTVICSKVDVLVSVQAWFQCLEVEMSPHNISVTVACPGPVFSNITAAAFTGKSGQVQCDTYCWSVANRHCIM